MEYIDKQNKANKGNAHAILDDFLERYQEGGEPFPKDLYDALKSDRKNNCVNTFRNYSERILEENAFRCCYCMRTIRRNVNSQRYPVTLEHVILNCIDTKEQYDEYFKYSSDLDSQNIVLTDDFLKNKKPTWPPYPHRIAYENLIPSCYGQFPSSGEKSSQTCNLKRGNDFVPPFVFRKKIHNEIKYYKRYGTIAWTADNGDEPCVNKLGLNYIALRLIRLAWYYLSSKGKGCEDRADRL